jgi:hypothetical protein
VNTARVLSFDPFVRNTTTLLLLSLLAACDEPRHDTETAEGGGIDLGESSGGEAGSGGEESGGSETTGGEDPGVDPDEPPHCGSDRIEVTAIPPNVVLVLDKSGSMTDPGNDWDHDGDPATPDQSRWTSLHDVVADLLQGHDDTMSFGAALFPAIGAQTSGSACLMEDELEVPVAPENAANILTAIPDRLAQTSGGTPARFGVLNAVDHLVDLQSEGSRIIVLVTDGEANCVPGVSPFQSRYDAELELAVASAYDDLGITTYVVGIDIDDENLSGDDDRSLRQAMNGLAAAGGAARGEGDLFYAVSDHDALETALDEIAARVECTVELTDFPAHPIGVELTIDGERIDPVDSCELGDGWRFVADQAPFDTIELCGSACDRFVAAGALEATFECLPEG